MVGNEVFSREMLAGYDPAILHEGTVLVIGAGAIGQNLLQNLALSGVGEILIVDHDHFEEHNRTRSPLYPTDIQTAVDGTGKARLVAEKLFLMMTAPEPVIRYSAHLIQDLGDGAFVDVDVIVSCVDNPRGRAWLADKARLHRIPFIEGGFDGPELTLSCYPVPNGPEEARLAPCWRCSHPGVEGVFSCRFYALQAEAQGIIPAIQNGAAAIGALQAEAAIMALHGEMPLANQRLILNLRTGRSILFELALDPLCPGFHRTMTNEPEILRVTGDNSLADLVGEASERLGEPATIVLPEPLVWEAPCTGCGAALIIGEPAWRWVLSPQCNACNGGHIRLVAVGSGQSPTIYTEVNPKTDSEILAITCAKAGLPALAFVEVYGDKPACLFSLGGSLDDLFVTVR